MDSNSMPKGSSGSDLHRFAERYGLAIKQNAPIFEDDREPNYYIPGNNGFVQMGNASGRLLAGIIYLSNWERVKKEFRLSYHHCKILPPLMPELGDDNCIRVEFAPENERQARLIVELTAALRAVPRV